MVIIGLHLLEDQMAFRVDTKTCQFVWFRDLTADLAGK